MSSRPRVVFFGTPEFAVPILEALHREAEVALVITQPDRPSGRGRKPKPPPVKIAAERLGVEVVQPDVVKGRRFTARIATYNPDFVVTAAFGRLLGRSLLSAPEWACLNVHASLLPRYRGAAPANWAILRGERESGVSIVKMIEELDAGPVFSVVRTQIGEEETAGELLVRLAALGAETLLDTLRRFDNLSPEDQNPSEVSWAPVLKKKDGVVDWKRSAPELHHHVRGMSPWPTATTRLQSDPLKIHGARVVEEDGNQGLPGTVLHTSDKGIDVACGGGVLRLVDVQAAGRKRMPASVFIAGTRIDRGVKLGE